MSNSVPGTEDTPLLAENNSSQPGSRDARADVPRGAAPAPKLVDFCRSLDIGKYLDYNRSVEGCTTQDVTDS